MPKQHIGVKKKVVVIGGGTGTFSVLSGLKAYADTIDLSAIITTADSGGSAGRLRDAFGKLPVGDVRMALLALADESLIDSVSLRELFLYRFEKGGDGLSGHNFGNLLLTALSDVVGSEKEAIEIVSRMLGLQGRVLPVTYDDITLVATYSDGVRVEGEAFIDTPSLDRKQHRITSLEVSPQGLVSPEAKEAVENADLIILGPGDLYTSLLASVVVGDMREHIARAPGRFVFISNLMSRAGQTTGFNTREYLREVEAYIGRAPDAVLINSAPLSPAMRAAYSDIDERIVEDAGAHHEATSVIRGDFLSDAVVAPQAGDTLTRSLVRHDARKLARAIIAILHP